MKLKFKYSGLLLTLVFFAGCSLWGNFTAYFNLYYNTSQKFDEAEKLIYAQERDLFSTEPLVIPGSASTLLNQVIEKSSKILQFHNETAYVDEALLMLGKSFYYQKDYQKALRKFSELIASRPESEYVLETRLWIAKVQMRLKNYSEALEMLQGLRDEAVEEGEDEIIKDAFVEEIVYKIQNEQYEDAIGLSARFLELSDDDVVNAAVVFELGRLYRQTGNLNAAGDAFRKVYDYDPSYELDYKANLELAKTLRELGRSEDALELLSDMRDEDKYSDYYDEIDLEQGITLSELKKPEEAIETLKDVDTSYAASLNSGIARLKMGEIYEKQLLNYDSASAYYAKAAGSQAPPEYVILAAAKNNLFKQYNELAASLRENRKQLNYIENPESFTQDSLEYVTKMQELKASEDVSYLFEVPKEIDTSRTSLDSLAMLKALDSLGVLKRFDSLYVQNELDSLEMTTILDSIKFAQNAERLTQQQQQQQQKGTGRDGGDTGGETGQDTSAASKLVMPVKTLIPPDSLKKLLAKNKFDLGNMFFTELDRRDSSHYYYTDLLSKHPDSKYEGQALFALGSYYLAESDTAKADSLFNIVYENFKNESVVNAAANQLKKPLINLNYDPAEELYENAERVMLAENYDSSLVEFYNVAESYPESPIAPKALFASGWILENKLKMYDSAAVVYDSLTSKYPLSGYSSRVLPKLNVYREEQARIQKAIDDSLAQLAKDTIQTEEDTIKTPIDGIVPSDTAETFEQKSNELDSVFMPEDSVRIKERDLNVYGDPGNLDNTDIPETPADTMLQRLETVLDTLQGHNRRGLDSAGFISPPIDSLHPGNPEGDPP